MSTLDDDSLGGEEPDVDWSEDDDDLDWSDEEAEDDDGES